MRTPPLPAEDADIKELAQYGVDHFEPYKSLERLIRASYDHLRKQLFYLNRAKKAGAKIEVQQQSVKVSITRLTLYYLCSAYLNQGEKHADAS